MKRKIVTVILALSMVSALIGCGKTKEEKESSRIEKDIKEQFGDNISDQTAKEMADAIAGVEDTEEYDGPIEEIEETSQEEGRHFDPLPEIVNSTFNDGLIQVGDALFTVDESKTYDDVMAVLDNSFLKDSYEVEFDEEGNKVPRFKDLPYFLCFMDKYYDSNGTRTQCWQENHISILADVQVENPEFYKFSNLSMDSIYVAHGLCPNDDFTLDELKELLNNDGFTEEDDNNWKNHENDGYYYSIYDGKAQRVIIYGNIMNTEDKDSPIRPCMAFTFDMDGNNITELYHCFTVSYAGINHNPKFDYFKLAE